MMGGRSSQQPERRRLDRLSALLFNDYFSQVHVGIVCNTPDLHDFAG
ncbi:MAG: hypothetical protein ACI9PY_000232 [Ascidiaceihabitans sp.]|jgi:hypothetical protein